MSRESAFLLNNVFFVVVTLAVIFGTLYPMAAAALSGETVTVGAPWFNRVNAPIFLALLFLMGVGPALPWGGASWRSVRERFAVPMLAGTLAALLGWLLGLRDGPSLLTLGLALFVVTIMGDEVWRGARARGRARGEALPRATWRLATRNRRRYGGYAVHTGIAVMAVAIAISATQGSDATSTLRPGESMTLGAYAVTFDEVVVEPLAADPRVIETRAELTLAGPQSGSMAAALRDYPNSTSAIATPAVRTAVGEDLYVTLLAYDPASGSVTLRVFLNPMVAWIWIGGGIVALGGIFAAWPDRRRVPAAEAVPA